MERLSNIVRSKISGIGPITGSDLSEAYNTETGQAAGEGVLAHLQRLPGLTQRDSDPGSRSFVDEDMLAALQGSAFARMILTDDTSAAAVPIAELSDKAVSMASYILQQQDTSPETIITVAERISRHRSLDKASPQKIADCVMVALHMSAAREQHSIDFRGLAVDGGVVGTINMEEVDITGLDIRNSAVREVVLSAAGASNSVKISHCSISRVSGVANEGALPSQIFSACDVEEFDDMSTNSAVMKLAIAPQLKALITILRKLYKQAGAGRKVTALNRGVTNSDVQRYIARVLDTLEAHGFITIFNKIVHPVRKQAGRVEKILNAPMYSNDELVRDVVTL